MRRMHWIVVLPLCLACREREKPPVAIASAAPIAWALDAPDNWADRVELDDAPAAGGARSAQRFLYTPSDSALAPSALVVVSTYDVAAWTQGSAARGDSLAADGSQVIAATVASANPYPADSRDARVFDSLRVDLAAVRQAFRVIR